MESKNSLLSHQHLHMSPPCPTLTQELSSVTLPYRQEKAGQPCFKERGNKKLTRPCPLAQSGFHFFCNFREEEGRGKSVHVCLSPPKRGPLSQIKTGCSIMWGLDQKQNQAISALQIHHLHQECEAVAASAPQTNCATAHGSGDTENSMFLTVFPPCPAQTVNTQIPKQQ